MGGKIRHTKLSKAEHPYDLEANGVKWTVWIDEHGLLLAEAHGLARVVVVPIDTRRVAVQQMQGG